jgi:hypothetical protein
MSSGRSSHIRVLVEDAAERSDANDDTQAMAVGRAWRRARSDLMTLCTSVALVHIQAADAVPRRDLARDNNYGPQPY